MAIRNIKRFLVGNPLLTEMEHHQRLPKWKALAVLSSDALSSVAYATEEVLIPLAAFTVAAVAWSMPIALAVGVLLFVVTVSYRQTIDSYPNGGGAYTVARENLGINSGLVAGAALLIDYVLTVAVSVAAGVENMASALPFLMAHKAGIGVCVIFVIMLFNLRGVRESANIFAIPTYFFVFSVVILIVTGAWKLATGEIVQSAPVLHETYPAIPLFLLLRAFSSGCAALTGIEAISNGIPIFKEPAQKNAKLTMAWMAFILGSLFLGITLMAHLLGVLPTEGETAISILARKVFPDSLFYYVIQVSTTLILLLAANTSYADFPRLSSLLAKDRYLPRQLSSLGDRLVFSNGIAGLSLAAIALIVLFEGDTHSLIPLYAVGVFLSFTLSQFGMVVHHLRNKQPSWRRALFFNFFGGLTTAIVLVVIGATKFTHGAWVVIVLIPLLVILFKQIHRHYVYTAAKLVRPKGKSIKEATHSLKHTAVVPLSGIHQGVVDALNYALSISEDVRACYVDINAESTMALQKEWAEAAPAGVPLIVLKSPYRSVIAPIVEYVDNVDRERQDDIVTVIIPEFVTAKWYHQLLHNQTAIVLYAALRGRRDVVVTSVRYHLD